MPNFAVLLPPSEIKQPGGNPFAPDMFDYRTSNTFNYFSDLNSERRTLIDTLQETVEGGGDGLEDMLGVEGSELEEAIRINAEIYDAPLMSALDRYSPGVLYAAMDFAGLPTGAQRRLLENGIIFSGLFGLLRPDDLIPNYRLRMDAELPEIGLVADFWRPRLSPLLNRAVEGRYVWDFLSEVQQAAWDDEHTYEEKVRVEFVDEENGEPKSATEDLKPLQGQFVNFIVRETLEDLEALQEWEHPAGYRYDEAASSFDEETKQRTIVMAKYVGAAEEKEAEQTEG